MTPAARRAAPTEVPGLAARRIAADIVDSVLRRRRPLDLELEGHPGLPALADRDRALTRMLTATVLRRLGTLRHVVGKFLERGFPADAPRVETALLIGAAQILFMDVPDHAAVDLSVRLVQADRRAARFPGLINAVLRRVAQDGPALLAELDAVPLDTPDWLFARWRKNLGDDTARADRDRPWPRAAARSHDEIRRRELGAAPARARAADRHGAHHHARQCRAAARLQ